MNLKKSLIVISSMFFLGHSYLVGAELQVQVTKSSEWDSGFCSTVSVYNPNDSKVLWNISFNPDGMITNLWNATFSQNQETLETTAVGLDWNNYVKAHKSISFGYCANKVIKQPSEGDLLVTQTQSAKWDGGFCSDVNVKNTTQHDIDWHVDFDVDGAVFELWNANYSQDSDTLKVTANGLDWNNVIKANKEVNFGYCADTISVEENQSSIGNTLDDNVTLPLNPIFEEFNIGFGNSYAYPFSSKIAGEKIWVSSVDLVLDDNIENNSYYQNIKNFDASAFDDLQNNLKNSKFLVYWLVDGWDESWFNVTKIQQAMDEGYIPVFNYWYFGDKLGDGMPNSAKQAEYTQDNEKVVTFLNKLNGTKLLIMEPEFNKQNILATEANQHEFASIIGKGIDLIKSNTSDILFSLAMTDTGSRSQNRTYTKCGFSNCALGDKYAWSQPEIIYNDIIHKLDFISFQEMVGQFSRDPSNLGDWNNPNPIAYSDADIGIDMLSTRIANFSEYLKEKYNKPVFLPYIAIATGTWNDVNNNNVIENSEVNYHGWEEKAGQTYQDLMFNKEVLKEKGLFGFATMALFDNPRHDMGGYQYFMNNEYHLGIISSGAIDEIDIATLGDIASKSTIVRDLFN